MFVAVKVLSRKQNKPNSRRGRYEGVLDPLSAVDTEVVCGDWADRNGMIQGSTQGRPATRYGREALENASRTRRASHMATLDAKLAPNEAVTLGEW